MAGVARYNISEISPNVSNAMVVAIIIGKQKPRNFPQSKFFHTYVHIFLQYNIKLFVTRN
jgi:hypothetical protein